MNIPPPLAVLAELTHRCPLRCPYCSNPTTLHKRSEELDTDTWQRVLSEAADMGILQVHFSGGEPAARHDLLALVEHAEKVGLYSNLITSGVMLDREQLRALRDAGLQHVQVSFQGSEATLADHVAGYLGGHNKKLEFSRHVSELGLPLTINAVMHRGNIDEVDAVIDMAVELQAQRIEVANTQYYGWGLLNRAALLPTRDQLVSATAKVEAARERLQGVLVIDYVVPDYYARRPKSCMNGWGQRFINVAPDGRIMPCHAAMTIPDMQFDRIQDSSLREAWENSESFQRFRGTDWMPEPCASCDRKEIDWGGCRCQALQITGNAADTDPACELSPHHHLMNEVAVNDAEERLGEFVYRNMQAQKHS